MITADLKGRKEPPMSERILFSFKASNWVDGLAHALQEGLARVCGQNIAALQGTRFTHFARHDTVGEPMALSSHPVLKHHVEHLDFMLHETRRIWSRRVSTPTVLDGFGSSCRCHPATRQIQEMEEDGEDIQGGEDFLSDDNDYEEDEFTDEEDYEFLESGRMGSFPSMWMKTMRSSCTSFTYVGMAPPNRNQDAMMQLLQTLLADREDERAERQANIAALQQIANQGHGNHDHPGSKLKNFQNTNPPVFSKTEEPLDADDWLQTMENNLEVAGVDENEKVLFATHYLAGLARAWWTSACALNAGQMMTWADFKLKFSKYHVPPGLIKKMRDEFRELKQGRMSVVEYRDRFLTLSRYAPDETDTTEKRKERFLNGLHDEMQTVLVNIPFADLEALVDSAIQMEVKLHQANENRKRRMMHQSGPNNTRYRITQAVVSTPETPSPRTRCRAPVFKTGVEETQGQRPHTTTTTTTMCTTTNYNRAPQRAPANNNPNNSNTAPRTGSNAIPVTPKDKATITCYECGIVGHYSNECPKRLAKLAGNTSAPAQHSAVSPPARSSPPTTRTTVEVASTT
ncbi:hypothetical protein QYE76_066295 [Lolium multiflorum]|uniref:CCHC-type domain-containing protein n=1 Tax=Lolium multiflorum TaxID=4521 RepID=A0AAD8SAR4_LOLMU|nr:hypothetical protein QYE76_066295 [Lolium multiflorum]